MLKKLPIGIQTLSQIIEDGYLYVDKTKYIYKLLQGKYYFFSRPRRFGKSLLISTLKEIFSGNQELFQGLWIYDQITWEKHPVIHLDFSAITHSEGRENFKKNLNYILNETATKYGLDLNTDEPKEKLRELAKKLHEKYQKVVILIDEYDKPIVDYIEKPAKAEENKELLASFYEVIKYIDVYTKFVFITGVSKFSKVSIFSKLNNLLDITLDGKFAELVGYTQTELEGYFAGHLEVLRENEELSKEQLLKKIKTWYNGYSWYKGQNKVYNPFGILNLFYHNEFQNYWFTTATPTFLIKLIKEQRVAIEDFEGHKGGRELFDSYDLENLDPVSLLFQTGYLTIKGLKKERYIFDYPNLEVKRSFLTYLLADYANLFISQAGPVYLDLLDYLEEEQLSRFATALTALFAGIPSQLHLAEERYYHSLSYLILALLGAEINLEDNTDKGRIDAVLTFEKVIYIIEFKMDEAEKGLAQIKDKKYYEKFLTDPKKIILLGVGGFRQKDIRVVSKVWQEG